MLHLLCCIVRAARGMLSSSRSDGASCARVQNVGGVLLMVNGNATFEDVAISDTSVGVRVARGGPIGAGGIVGAAVCRAVAWWRCMVGQSASTAAASHALRRCAILVADSCACRMELHGERCTVAWRVVHVATYAAHHACMFDVT
jgi:hypothetical protein